MNNLRINKNTIGKELSNEYLSLHAGPNSPYFILFSNEYPEEEYTSSFMIDAYDGTNTGTFRGYSNGILKWNGMSLNEAAIVSKSISTHGYIKYASGLIIQWVSAQLNSGHNANISFPITFPVGSKAAVCTPNIDNTSVAIYGLYNSYFQTYASKSCLCWHLFVGY